MQQLLTSLDGRSKPQSSLWSQAQAVNGNSVNVWTVIPSENVQTLDLRRQVIRSTPKLRENKGNPHDHGADAVKALLSTDMFPKMTSHNFTPPNSTASCKLAGITKGSSMIHPDMATNLGIICTNAPVTPGTLQCLLSTAADESTIVSHRRGYFHQ